MTEEIVRVFRNTKDFLWYFVKLNIFESLLLIFNITFYIVAFKTFCNEFSTAFFQIKDFDLYFICFIIFLFVKFLFDSISVIYSIYFYKNLKYGEMVSEEYDFSKIELSQFEINNEFYPFENPSTKDYVMMSEIANKYIREQNSNIKIDKPLKKNIRHLIKDNSGDLKILLQWKFRESLFYGKDFYNENKLCLSRDLPISTEESQTEVSQEVYCHKGSYYDTFLTNQICGKKLSSNKDNRIIVDATRFMPIDGKKDGSIRFKSISSSTLNNEIGISTIGITKDNYIVIWKQNKRAQSSADLLVPTGSGSCDWKDKKDVSFNKTIERAMQRELWEESGKKILWKSYDESFGETKVIGFFRWLNKGGKPEFVGITKLNVCFTAFRANKKEVYEGIDSHFNDLEQFEECINDLLSLKNISTPLYVNLACLMIFIKNDEDGKNQEWLKDFLDIDQNKTKNMKGELKKVKEKEKGLTSKNKVYIGIFSGILFGFFGPIIINELYKPSIYRVSYLAMWNAADLLQYYGTLLGAIATIIAVVWTIDFSKKSADRNKTDNINAEYRKIGIDTCLRLMDILDIQTFEKYDKKTTALNSKEQDILNELGQTSDEMRDLINNFRRIYRGQKDNLEEFSSWYFHEIVKFIENNSYDAKRKNFTYDYRSSRSNALLLRNEHRAKYDEVKLFILETLTMYDVQKNS